MSLEHPPYWYVYVPRPADGPLEVVAIAPTILRRDLFSRDAQLLMGAADQFIDEHPRHRIVFAGELTIWLHHLGRTWSDIGIDFYEAIGEIEDKAPSLWIQLNQIAYSAVGDTGLTVSEVWFSTGERVNVKEHSEPVRAALLETLEGTWPAHMATCATSG